MRELITNADNDLAYGPRLDPQAEGYTLGKFPFNVDDIKDVIHIGDKTFPGSAGLFELIFKSHPREVGEGDKKIYGEIMRPSSLHLNERGGVKSNRREKNTKFIKSLKDRIEERRGDHEITSFYDAFDSFSGGGLQSQYIKKPVRYVYWDDPNESVERLKLLVSERSAGYGSLNNEIISILEELRERSIIINTWGSHLFPTF